MSRRPYIPTCWDSPTCKRAYLRGWKDAEFGLDLGAGAQDDQGRPLEDRMGDHAKAAYEAGFADFQRKHAALRGGA